MEEDRPFRMILAGCGSIAGAWVESVAAHPDAELVALVDPETERAAALGDRFSLSCPVFGDLTDAIGAADANVILDVTPPGQHLAVAAAAVEAGCAVLAEKPLALSLTEGFAIAETMDKAGLFYAVMQNRRYFPGVQALRTVVADGVLGDVSLVTAELFLRGGGAGAARGFRGVMPYPLLWDMGIHAFDAVRAMLGSDAVSVSARTGNPSWAGQAGDTMASCNFEMAGGSAFWYRGALWGGSSPNNYNGVWRVIGSKGTASWDGRSDVAHVALASSGPSRAEAAAFDTPPGTGRPGHGDYHDACFAEMMDALAAREASTTAIGDNLRSVAMVAASILSAEQNRTVTLEEIEAKA